MFVLLKVESVCNGKTGVRAGRYRGSSGISAGSGSHVTWVILSRITIVGYKGPVLWLVSLQL